MLQAIINANTTNEFKLNKRVGIRFVTSEAKVTFHKQGLLINGAKHTGTLIDISSTGIMLYSTKPLSKSSKLDMKITFKDGTYFNMKGVVQRSVTRNTYGIKFTNINTILDDFLMDLFLK
jgi:hypothetical protein